MTATDDEAIDASWRDGLERAAPAIDPSAARDRVANRVDARRRRRTAVKIVGGGLASAVAVVVLVAVLGPGNNPNGSMVTTGPGTEPNSGLITTRVDVMATPTLRLAVAPDVVQAGNVEIHFATFGGTHELRIEGIPDFGIRVPRDDAAAVATIRLEPGKYVLFCPIAGHRAAGDEATLTVTADAQPPTSLPVTPSTTTTTTLAPPDRAAAVAGTINGSLTDGRPWSLRSDPEHGLCPVIDDEDLGCDDVGPVISPDGDPATMRSAIVDNGPDAFNQGGVLVYAYLPSGASTAVLTFADGTTSSAGLVIEPNARFWAVPVTPGRNPISVKYEGADGQEIPFSSATG